MSVNDSGESGGFWFQIELRQVVQHVDGCRWQLEHICHRQFLGPRFCINISADSSNGGYLFQDLQNCGIADVPGVNDEVRSGQRSERLGPYQAMRVGDDADSYQELRFQQFVGLDLFLVLGEVGHLQTEVAGVGGIGHSSFHGDDAFAD